MTSQGYAKQEAEQKERARIWLENLLGLDVEDDFFVALGDGVLLCSIVNTIKPGTIPKVFSAARCKKIISKKMDNINSFLLGARRIGVFSSYTFEVSEFVARKRPDKLVKCLLKLEEIASKAGINPSSGAGEQILGLQSQIEEEDKKKAEALRAENEAKEKADKEAQEAYLREREERRLQEEKERKEQEEKDKKLLVEMTALSLQEREEKQQKLQQEREAKAAALKEAEEKRTKEREEKIKKDKEAAQKRIEELKAKSAASSPKPSSSSSSSGGAPRTYSGSDAILYWAKTSCEDYGVEVTNFTTSWKDGLAFCGLVSSHFPKLLNFEACKAKTPNERLALAFEVAGSQGVPPLLDPEDITDLPVPDKRSIMTYLSCLYKGFKR